MDDLESKSCANSYYKLGGEITAKKTFHMEKIADKGKQWSRIHFAKNQLNLLRYAEIK